ncbi:CoA-transferase family III [Colletotrichum higginsianum IMI 349063]|uniref:CoA-transferase family III n=1 Tax=Colletotrichum higginsianum (strain IMI 349063) TaxID=759273 RepID=A0A1B7YSK2_COLHI|nr:CoA-transferase family III [Colletotrichum higginsianum IMI 349063]OBR15030.1 CoA-transferase family III [Colletotrichum higginsianum IMI 349063]
MAPLSLTSLLHAIASREASAANQPSSCAGSSGPCIEVICSWPLSGQYGLGQRVLYYALVATCVLARKAEWIRNVGLAAALILPAVAAVHGIVLAALHVDGSSNCLPDLLLRYQLTFCVRAYAGAIDLDVYGALQYCSIGILAGPVTVKLSTTYSNERGRNIIFLWTGLILAGLLSLAVEFYRAKSTPCFFDNAGNPISQDPGRFPYSEAMCGLTCSQENGPSSLLRTKAASEIFVVPVPTKLPLGNSMFLAAAECVPAILSLVSMWVKITNPDVENGRENEPIPGANGATFGNMKSINARIRDFLNAVEIPVFAGAVVAILIIGEINFSSPQMDYHTEPMGSIGQWGTILATGMAAFGSLYIYLAGMFMADQDDAPQEEARRSAHLTQKRSNEPHVEMEDYPVSPGDHGDPLARATSDGPESDQDQGYRRTISNALIKVNRFFGNKVQPSLQPDNYGNGVWPQIPGEMERNSRVTVTMDQFSMHNFRLSTSRDSHESYSGSEGGSVTPTAGSPTSREGSVVRASSRQERTARRYTEPSGSRPFAKNESMASSPTEPARVQRKTRSATLEVPTLRRF